MRSVFGAALNRWKLATETNSIRLIMYGKVLEVLGNSRCYSDQPNAYTNLMTDWLAGCMITPRLIGSNSLHLYQLNDSSLLAVWRTVLYFKAPSISMLLIQWRWNNRIISALSVLAHCTLHLVAYCPVQQMSFEWAETIHVSYRSHCAAQSCAQSLSNFFHILISYSCKM